MTSTPAEKLLRDIDKWTTRTKRTAGELGTMALRHPGFVPLLKKRCTLSDDTEARVRAFMKAFPDEAALPGALVVGLKNDAKAGVPWTATKHDAIMARLGFGAKLAQAAEAAPTKPRISAAVQRAAKLDGREIGAFVTALINMGLDCWRDDRAAHGEPVA